MKTVTEAELSAHAAERQAVRVTPGDLEAAIREEHYFTAEQGVVAAGPTRSNPLLNYDPTLSRLTFCVLVLQNGFTVTGTSACADPKIFDPAIGRRIARDTALNQLWSLLGYELRTKLAAEEAGAAS